MKIGIIGYGIVGATLAYLLSNNSDYDIHVYDQDAVQGTKHAVGIVCPWVSQRRNKTWYTYARDGAQYLYDLAHALKDDSFMARNGCLIVHEHLSRFVEIAQKRYQDAPLMGVPQVLNAHEIKSLLPESIKLPDEALYIPGAYQIDGGALLTILKRKSTITIHNEWAQLEGTSINGEVYDCVCVCAGGFTDSLLHAYSIDSKMQKGMLVELDDHYPTKPHQPVIMPQGEIDLLVRNSHLVFGASHQDYFDSFEVEDAVIDDLFRQAQRFIPTVDKAHIQSVLVGVRSVAHDNTPYITAIDKSIFVIAGLGSSGLTTGPLLAHKLATYLLGENKDPNLFDQSRIRR